MGVFADELRAGIAEAARNMAQSWLAGDDYGAEVYRERLGYLRRAALRHGVGLSPRPEPEGCGEARSDQR